MNRTEASLGNVTKSRSGATVNLTSRVLRIVMTVSALAAVAPSLADSAGLPCATSADKLRVKQYYEKEHPGAAMSMPSRLLDVPELVISSALPAEQSIGVVATPRITKDVWKTIDAWGADTTIKLVFASGGKHAFVFPTLVPITQPERTHPKGYLDMYADGGKGIHAHLQLAHVKAIYATDYAGEAADKRTRAVSFYGQDGNLILGVFASIYDEEQRPRAIEGFAKSWDSIKSLPRVCGSK